MIQMTSEKLEIADLHDANLDGVVDNNDAAIVAINCMSSGAVPEPGMITTMDALILAACGRRWRRRTDT